MLKNYDELIDLIHKNDKKIESLLNILTTKLSLVDIVNKKMSEGVLWRGISTNDVDHLNLTLALANRQVYENKLYNSDCKEPKKEQKQDTKALDLVNRRFDFVMNQLLLPILRGSYEEGLHIAREYEITFLKELKNVLSED